VLKNIILVFSLYVDVPKNGVLGVFDGGVVKILGQRSLKIIEISAI